MLNTRTPPTLAELVARAISKTPFVTEAVGDSPHDLRVTAELCAELAAEHWEREEGALIAATVPWELTTEVAEALKAHGQDLRDANDNALYTSHGRLERSLALVATARNSIHGILPLAAAEAQLTEVETHFDHIRIALTRARDVFTSAIDRIEAAAEPRREVV